MPKLDEIKNGIIFGALFGIVLLLAAENVAQLSFISDFITWISEWLIGLESWPEFLSSLVFIKYALMAIIGGAVGAYIDAR